MPELEHASAEFGPGEIEDLARLERVMGMAEVTDYLDVIHDDDRIMEITKIAEEHGLYLQVYVPLWR